MGGFKFRRQHVVGRFIVDFCCPEKKLIIEVDGGGHGEDAGRERDWLRDEDLVQRGWRVIRIWNSDIDGNFEGVMEEIQRVLDSPSPLSSPQKGEGVLKMNRLLLASAFCLFSSPLWAFNFLYIHPTTGEPVGWEPETIIHYWLDPGPLGRLTNDQAKTLVQEAMEIWEDASANANTPHFEFSGYLPEDVNGTNYQQYVAQSPCYENDLEACPSESQKNLQTVIVFDEDQSFLNELCITGCGFAIAGARVFGGSSANPDFIRQGIVVIGSTAGDPNIPIASIIGRLTHELGHLLGLAHTSVNQEPYINDATGFEPFVPTMFYSFAPKSQVDQQTALATLSPDDIAGIEVLYPSDAFDTDTATIKGKILKSDGSEMIYVNVIARNIEDPLCEAYSFLNGRTCDMFPVDECNKFEIYGLPPGTYTLEVEEVADENLAMTLAPGLVDPFIYGDAEFWNESDAAGDPSNLTISTITLAAGETRENIDIILNRSEVTDDRVKYIPLDTFTPGPGTRCPEEPPIDYAEMIGIDEGDDSDDGGSTPSPGGCSFVHDGGHRGREDSPPIQARIRLCRSERIAGCSLVREDR